MPQPSKKVIAAVEALNKEQLIYEIDRAEKSDFSHNIPLLKLRLRMMEDADRGQERREDLEIAREANVMSKEALKVSEEANTISTNGVEKAEEANRLSKWALGIAVGAFLLAIGVAIHEVSSNEGTENNTPISVSPP